jgi:hypothetical protein
LLPYLTRLRDLLNNVGFPGEARWYEELADIHQKSNRLVIGTGA